MFPIGGMVGGRTGVRRLFWERILKKADPIGSAFVLKLMLGLTTAEASATIQTARTSSSHFNLAATAFWTSQIAFTLGQELKLLVVYLVGFFFDRGGTGVLVLKRVVHLSERAHLFFVAWDELHAEFAGDVVDHGFRKRDMRVLGHALRLETNVAEFLNERFEWHSVLQTERHEGADGVHQAVNSGAGLSHLDEDFAGLAVVEFTHGNITFSPAE